MGKSKAAADKATAEKAAADKAAEAKAAAWGSDPNDSNNVKIERELRRVLNKPTGELGEGDEAKSRTQ